MLTKTRGNNAGNILAMIVGFLAVCILSGLHNTMWIIFLHDGMPAICGNPRGCPEIAFPWRMAFGTVVTFCDRDSVSDAGGAQQEIARRHVENSEA